MVRWLLASARADRSQDRFSWSSDEVPGVGDAFLGSVALRLTELIFVPMDVIAQQGAILERTIFALKGTMATYKSRRALLFRLGGTENMLILNFWFF